VRSLAKLPVVDVDRELVLAAIALSRSAQQSAVGCGDRRRGAAGRVRAAVLRGPQCRSGVRGRHGRRSVRSVSANLGASSAQSGSVSSKPERADVVGPADRGTRARGCALLIASGAGAGLLAVRQQLIDALVVAGPARLTLLRVGVGRCPVRWRSPSRWSVRPFPWRSNRRGFEPENLTCHIRHVGGVGLDVYDG